MMENSFQEQMITFIRQFGLHHPEQTPCGKPISVAEAHALMELEKESVLTQHTLVTRLNLAKSTVSRLVGKLVKHGWVTKQPSPQDKRVAELHLTEAGQEVAQELAHARQAKFAHILTHIPDTQQAQVVQTLQLLTKAIQEAEHEL